jgi:hypothetical protein
MPPLDPADSSEKTWYIGTSDDTKSFVCDNHQIISHMGENDSLPSTRSMRL